MLGLPKTVVTKENIDLVHDMVLNDRRITVRFLPDTYGICVQKKILYDEWFLRVSARQYRNSFKLRWFI